MSSGQSVSIDLAGRLWKGFFAFTSLRSISS